MATEIKVEMPNSDALAIFRSSEEMVAFLDEHGNPEVKYDPTYGVYRVPAFANGREQYTNTKAKECEKWGCE